MHSPGEDDRAVNLDNFYLHGAHFTLLHLFFVLKISAYNANMQANYRYNRHILLPCGPFTHSLTRHARTHARTLPAHAARAICTTFGRFVVVECRGDVQRAVLYRYVYIYIHIYINVYIYVCMYVYVCIYNPCALTCLHTHCLGNFIREIY
jgi:hypothetical protein